MLEFLFDWMKWFALVSIRFDGIKCGMKILKKIKHHQNFLAVEWKQRNYQFDKWISKSERIEIDNTNV